MRLLTPEQKAVLTGKVDAALTVLFVALSYGFTELVSWLVTILPGVTSSDWGKYNWLKVPVSVFVGGLLKGYDRKKHEDPTPSTGLIEVDKIVQAK